MTIAGKVTLITGGTSGIGAACAVEFGRCGAPIVIHGRDSGRALAVADRLRAASVPVVTIIGDVRNQNDCEEAVRCAVRSFGRLDILINCAGIIIDGDALTTSPEAWLSVMDVNVNGSFWMCRAAILEMQRGGGGSIVNVASDWGVVGGRNHVAYCTSKGAIVNMTRAMALDHASDNIRVNVICPGEVDTPMLEAEIARVPLDRATGYAELAASIPLGRISTPEEQARSIRFLASPEASFITGAVLSVDGGSTAH